MALVLHGRSDFSIGQSLLSPEEIAKSAAALGYKAAALCDTTTISGAIEFTKACEAVGIQPLVGARIRIVDDPLLKERQSEYFFDLLIKNEEGYRKLCRLLSTGNQEDHFYYFPRNSFSEFCEAIEGNDLVVVCSDAQSVFHRRDYVALLEKALDALARKTEDLFVRLNLIDTPIYEKINRLSIEWAATNSIRILPSRAALYRDEEDAKAKDVLGAVVGNSKITRAKKPFQRNQYPISATDFDAETQKYADKWGVTKEVLAEAERTLTESVQWKWKNLPICLPKMAADEFSDLMQLCKEGWKDRLSREVMGYKPDPSQIPEYKARLAYELQILKRLNFSGYFLLVRQIVAWSKDNGVLVGPGRGSVGGSLIAYLIGITDVDPIRFGLLFERFINPDRIDLPDADLDFMSSRRDEVIRHIEKTFGEEYVVGLSNYTYLGPSSAIRDLGRVYEMDPRDYECSKQVPKVHGQSSSLKEAADQVPAIARFRDDYPTIWKYANRLDGVMRSLGKHAAGIIVAGEPVVNRSVVELRSGYRTSNWDMRVSESAGLVKFDVLGLSTLDLLAGAISRIKERTGTEIDLLSIPLRDHDVLRAFGRGETAGVFQFESSGMRGLLKSLAISGDLVFEDLVAATALYRPGPMDSGLMQDYINVRQGMVPPRVDHPNMEDALKETYGIIVYQEQVMQIARDLAGFSMTEADHLRKAMGKKDIKKMAAMKEKFVSGAKSHSGMAESNASDLFDKIEKFAGYAFNKSHSVEYAVISWWTMWLKVHYPTEFYASSMSIVDDPDRIKVVVKDAEKDGIKILPPDLNLSTDRFEAREVDGEMVLLAPFNSVKNCSEGGAKAIIKAREHVGGAFTSIKHFEETITELGLGRMCNSRSRANLQKVGAFASVDKDELKPLDPGRLKDQLELMPGVISKSVKATRRVNSDKATLHGVVGVMNCFMTCSKCDLAGKTHVKPKVGKSPKFMMVFDGPSYSDEKAGKIMEGHTASVVKDMLNRHGLSLNDGYYTSLMRAAKDDDGYTTEQISACSGHLDAEVELLKPPVIVTMGKNALRHFCPELKGNWADLAGTAHYNKEKDRTVIAGFNPGMLYHDPSRERNLLDVFARLSSVVN